MKRVGFLARSGRSRRVLAAILASFMVVTMVPAVAAEPRGGGPVPGRGPVEVAPLRSDPPATGPSAVTVSKGPAVGLGGRVPVPPPGSGTVATSTPPGPVLAPGALPGRGFVEGESVELVSERTPGWRTFANGDGSRTRVVSGGAQGRFLRDGKWLEVSNELVPVAGGGFRNRANSFSVNFRAGGEGVQLTTPEGPLTMTPVGGRFGEVVADEAAGTVTYAETWPGVDVRYQLQNNGIKEEIVVKRPQGAAAFAFRVDGTRFVVRPDGGLEAKGPLAEVWSVAPPAVFAADGSVVPAAAPKFMVGGDVVTLAVDPAWVANLEASDYPVVLDPSLTHSRSPDSLAWRNYAGSGLEDVRCDVNEFGNCQVQVGRQSGILGSWRSRAFFPYKDINGKISNVKVVLTSPVTEVWENGDGVLVVNAGAADDRNWATNGAELGRASTASKNFTLESAALTQYYQGLVQAGDFDEGLKFRLEDEGIVRYMRWFQFELEISYIVPGTLSSPADGAGLATSTPTLSATPRDSGSEHRYVVASTSAFGATTKAASPWSGSPGSWTVPTGALGVGAGSGGRWRPATRMPRWRPRQGASP